MIILFECFFLLLFEILRFSFSFFLYTLSRHGKGTMQYTENNSTYYTVRNEIKVDALCSLSSFYFSFLFIFYYHGY